MPAGSFPPRPFTQNYQRAATRSSLIVHKSSSAKLEGEVVTLMKACWFAQISFPVACSAVFAQALVAKTPFKCLGPWIRESLK